MSLKILVTGDPLHELKPRKESTLALVKEAWRRGHHVDYCTPADLGLTNGKILGNVQEMRLTDDYDDYFRMGGPTVKNLEKYDIILMRSNPKGYKRMNTFYMLDTLADKVFITNDPRGMREMHGKFFITHFSDFIVPYMIAENKVFFENFLQKHKDIIVKPLNGFGGQGVSRIREVPDDIDALYNKLNTEFEGEPFIMQEYIPAATKGDKRIIMFDGEPVCSLLRVPKDENSLANVTQGATLAATEMTLREKALCEELGPILRDYGLFFVGVDMLGDYLTELNVISVGTIIPANNLYGIQLEKTFWGMLEKRYQTWKKNVGQS